MGGGGGGGMGGGGHASMGGGGGAVGAMSAARGTVAGPGPGAMNAGPGRTSTFNRAGPMTNGPVFNRAPINGPMGRTGNWANNWHQGHDHFHHRFHNRNFVAFGFGGGLYDYAYNSCWAQVPTYYGWQWVYVCGDYYGY